MTVKAAPGGYRLEAGEGDALWSADSLFAYKTTGTQTGGRFAMAEVTAARGTGSPPHRHHHEDEACYVLDGELGFWLGGDEFTAPAGAFVFGPRGLEHRFEVGPSEARFLLFLTPAGFEESSQICGTPASTPTHPADLPPKDDDVLAAPARTYGLEILPSHATTTKRDRP